MRTAPVYRRILAGIYDSLLLCAIWMLATAVWLALQKIIILPHWLYQSYLVGISFLFFGYFWVHAGQTLGMKAWRLRLMQPVGWRSAALRFVGMLLALLCFGLGILWAFLDPHQRMWQDYLGMDVGMD